MTRNISLNNSVFEFAIDQLPCLIHGKENEGASYFTVTLTANLFKQGYKVLFICGYHMARDEFREQVGEENTSDGRVIFIKREEVEKLGRVMSELDNIHEWVILIKNVDLFDESVFEVVKNHSRLILSGDLDKCSFARKIDLEKIESTVLFSKPKLTEDVEVPILEYREAFFSNKKGIKGKTKLS